MASADFFAKKFLMNNFWCYTDSQFFVCCRAAAPPFFNTGMTRAYARLLTKISS